MHTLKWPEIAFLLNSACCRYLSGILSFLLSMLKFQSCPSEQATGIKLAMFKATGSEMEYRSRRRRSCVQFFHRRLTALSGPSSCFHSVKFCSHWHFEPIVGLKRKEVIKKPIIEDVTFCNPLLKQILNSYAKMFMFTKEYEFHIYHTSSRYDY